MQDKRVSCQMAGKVVLEVLMGLRAEGEWQTLITTIRFINRCQQCPSTHTLTPTNVYVSLHTYIHVPVASSYPHAPCN